MVSTGVCTRPPLIGGLQRNPIQRIARNVIDVAVAALMSPSVASTSRRSAGRIVAAARMFCCRSIRCVWAVYSRWLLTSTRYSAAVTTPSSTRATSISTSVKPPPPPDAPGQTWDPRFQGVHTDAILVRLVRRDHPHPVVAVALVHEDPVPEADPRTAAVQGVGAADALGVDAGRGPQPLHPLGGERRRHGRALAARDHAGHERRRRDEAQ